MQALIFSLPLAKVEIQKKDEEIVTFCDACIDEFAEGANHIKAVCFQDFKEGKHLSWDVDQFLAEKEEAQELGDESEDSEATAGDAQAYFFFFYYCIYLKLINKISFYLNMCLI